MDWKTEALITDCLLGLSKLVDLDDVVHFKNNTFEMNSYCWCDGEVTGHTDGCPRNFIYQPQISQRTSGLGGNWYKHIGRGMEFDEADYKTWKQVMLSCFKSL